jgi:hypothetical protein
MMALTAARGCAFGFYLPAAQGLLPQIVGADQLTPANGVRRLGVNGAQIAGGLVGGVVVGAVGPGWVAACFWLLRSPSCACGMSDS